jgi:hypothetical protein
MRQLQSIGPHSARKKRVTIKVWLVARGCCASLAACQFGRRAAHHVDRVMLFLSMMRSCACVLRLLPQVTDQSGRARAPTAGDADTTAVNVCAALLLLLLVLLASGCDQEQPQGAPCCQVCGGRV